jgi:diaminopimelate epimerase
MRILKFTKMHALGNDFMVIDGVNQPWVGEYIQSSKTLLKNLSDRHRGIGFDQCLLIENPFCRKTGNFPIDFFYSIFNADGSEVGQCGNGARCVARFIHEQKLSSHKKYHLATKTTQLTVEVHDKNYKKITAELAIPQFFSTQLETYENIAFHAVDLGNPHAVIHMDNIQDALVDKIGRLMNSAPFHSFFPSGVNVGFMEIHDNHHLKLRVYERGAAETQACGSGACAAMVCARKFYHTDSTMTVELPGGALEITWMGEGFPVSVTGDAVRVFDGQIDVL